jgi:hypothetical protein
VRQALSAWSNVANITFVEQGSGTLFTQSTADIAFTPIGDELGVSAISRFPSPAFADDFLKGTDYTRTVYPKPEGDVFLSEGVLRGFHRRYSSTRPDMRSA